MGFWDDMAAKAKKKMGIQEDKDITPAMQKTASDVLDTPARRKVKGKGLLGSDYDDKEIDDLKKRNK